jgi:hypothetical protein
MILMRKVSLFKFLVVLASSLLLSACWLENDNSSDPDGINVAGTWTAPVRVDSCSPSDVCRQAGFTQGQTFDATMQLRQNGSDVNGTYTYARSNISADVSGRISGTQLTLNGNVQNPFGTATVHFVGSVSNSVINATVSHNVSLFDGRSGTVAGSGAFSH